MKIFLALLLFSTILLSFETKAEYVGRVEWSMMSSKKIYKACIEGVYYYLVDEGYHSALAPVWTEIDHPIMGKIMQPAKCTK